MIPLIQLIKYFRELLDVDGSRYFLEVRANYLAPTLHIDIIRNQFSEVPYDDRLQQVFRRLKETQGAQINSLEFVKNLPVLISPLTSLEALEKQTWAGSTTDGSWVSWFLERTTTEIINKTEGRNYLHFYGYKGGQARSSVLALFAKSLADDGYKVLVIDADIEAPSMDSLFATYADNFSQTLMGFCGWSETVTPIAGAYIGKSNAGRIDLVPCRPRTEDSDLDFALLVATAPIDVRLYEDAAERIDKQLSALADPYDFVLLDHRTGISSSVLPLIRFLPGPTTIFARADSNTSIIPSDLRRILRSIFRNSGEVTGAFVSFSLDPKKSGSSSPSASEARMREQLLDELANSMQAKFPADSEILISSEELAFNWVDWYLDRSLMDDALPDIGKLQTDNIASLQNLREALGLPAGKKAAANEVNVANFNLSHTTSLSGAKDGGELIHIPDIERLFVPRNPYTYILGRKGTGKTRLLREVATRGLGEPILVAADEGSFAALRSESVEAVAWVKACKQDPSVFWWSLIRIKLDSINNQESLIDRLSAELLNKRNPSDFSDPIELKALLSSQTLQHTLLVDGLETLVPAAQIKAYVASLFSVMNTIQNDPQLSLKLVLRAFVREDLASDAVQNIEQQMEGRALKLKWSASSILNFAVSRIPMLPWIGKNFPELCSVIQNKSAQIVRSELSAVEATELLLEVFPARIRRNNLSTATFLKLYFSDAGGDDTNMATFYPRLYLSFLQRLDAIAATTENSLNEQSRLDSSLLNKAYDDASSEFISETKQELAHLLSLHLSDAKNDAQDDQTRVTKFIASFDGLSTPFALDRLVGELITRTSFTEESVRESLRRMKNLRMFEDRPGHGGWWRVGQLYKMGLRMKYVR